MFTKIANMRSKGATIVELTVVMAIMGIIAGMTVGIIIPLTQMFMDLPQQIIAQQIAQDFITAMVDGTPDRPGLRAATKINSANPVSWPYGQIDYTFGYPTSAGTMRFIFVPWGGGFSRQCYDSAGTELENGTIPVANFKAGGPYIVAGIGAAQGQSAGFPPTGYGTVFSYFKKGNVPWNPAVDGLDKIDRVDIGLTVWRGSMNWGTSKLDRQKLYCTVRHSVGIKYSK